MMMMMMVMMTMMTMIMMIMMIEDLLSIFHQLSLPNVHDDDDDGGRVGAFFRSQLSCKTILAGWLFSAVFPILKINVSS